MFKVEVVGDGTLGSKQEVMETSMGAVENEKEDEEMDEEDEGTFLPKYRPLIRKPRRDD